MPYPQRPLPPVSLVLTVLNEANGLPALLQSIDNLTLPPNEVVIVDGGSKDETLALLDEWAAAHPAGQVRILRAPAVSIAQGRNLGIGQAQNSVIAVTDGGVVLHPDWLERLTRALAEEPQADVASGFFDPDIRSARDWAMASTLLPHWSEINGARFLPSSRSIAFRKLAWQRVGGYPAWLDYCEDLAFDLALQALSSRFIFVPTAIVYYRPPPSLRAHFRQYFRYARGDGKADLWRRRHAVRYGAYLTGAALTIGALRRPRLWVILGVGALLHLRLPLRRLVAFAPLVQTGETRVGDALVCLEAMALLPVIRLAGDTAKMAGYPLGVFWRLTSGDPRAGSASWRGTGRTPGRGSFPIAAPSPIRASEACDLSIIVVSYNASAALGDCLHSIARSEGLSGQTEVFVVDNASTDGSPQMVARDFPWVHLIANPANVGFAQASNQGLARAQGRHLLLLNPDAELPPHALAAMVGYLEQHPRAGVVGPKLVRLDGSLDPACRRSFPTPTVALYRLIGLSRMFPRSPRFGRYNLTFLDPAVEGEVDAVSGAFMLVRRQAFLEAGFLDDRFFLYGEDLDWAYRIKALGWEVRYNPDVVVLHRKGESSRQVSRSATLAFYRAMQLFFDRHLRQSTPPAIAGLIVAAIHVRMAWSLLRDRARRPTQRKVST